MIARSRPQSDDPTVTARTPCPRCLTGNMLFDREDGMACLACGHRRPDNAPIPHPDMLEDDTVMVRDARSGEYRVRQRRRGPMHNGNRL